MGYSGGTTKNPTYRSIGDHAETTEIDFDPAKTSYEKLLDVFWATHNPCARAYSRQYMSAVFTRSEEQKRLALEAKAREEKKRGKAVATEISAFAGFTLAENYHQKYELQNSEALLKEFKAHYPDFTDFVNSTAVTRANGYLGGNGTAAQLKAELESLGLSAEAARILQSRVR